MAPQGEVEATFSLDSLPVEHLEVEFETSINCFTKVDELTVVNADVGKSFELTKLVEEPEIITCHNVIYLDTETLEKCQESDNFKPLLKIAYRGASCQQ